LSRIENHKYTIQEAFQECFYVVPDYQREYVWKDKEVQQLLDDIVEQLDAGSNREYFIGTILVAPTANKGHYEVIDGQQRLTTFFLMLCALRKLFAGVPQQQTIANLISSSFTSNDGESSVCLKLSPRYESAEELMNEVVSTNGDPESVRDRIRTAGITSFGSLDNLLNAYSTLHNYLSDTYKDAAELKKFWGYLANYVVFIQIQTDISSALKIFETINERGVGLNPMDLLKNLLFTHVKQDQFNRLKDDWKKITKPLEKAKEKPLRFLRYFIMANYKIKNDRGDGIVREDEIYDWFVDKDNALICNYGERPFDFVSKIVRNVERHLSFAEGRGPNGSDSLAMQSLKLLCGGGFSLHHVLLLAASDFPKPLFDHFLRQLESFLFYYIFTKTPTKDLERNFSVWADELRVISKIGDSKKQRERLNSFVADRFQKNMAGKERELQDALKRYSLYSMQQYRTRYLLAKLTQHVDMAFKGLKTLGSLEEYTVLEIEHILPNTPKAELRKRFETSAATGSYEEYKVRLGNLTLLEKPINIVAGNDFFALKLAQYRKCKNYLTSSLAELHSVGKNSSINRINGKLKAFDTWNSKNIDERQKFSESLDAGF